jgi:hypothetical protein
VRRRSPVFLGTVGTIVALLAALGAGVVAHAVTADDPSGPKPEVTLHFDKSDDQSSADDLIGGDPTG